MPKISLSQSHRFTKTSLAYALTSSDLPSGKKEELLARLKDEPESSVFTLEIKKEGGASIFIETHGGESKK